MYIYIYLLYIHIYTPITKCFRGHIPTYGDFCHGYTVLYPLIATNNTYYP